MCARQVLYCLIVLHPSSEMSLLIGLFSHLDLLPKKPKKRSMLQLISVLKPGCLNLFDVFSTYLQLGGQVYGLSAEISHLRLLKTPQPQTAAGSHCPRAGQTFCFCLEHLFAFFTLSPFPSPEKMLIHAGATKKETGEPQVQGLLRPSSSKPVQNLLERKAKQCFHRSREWRS